MANRRDEIVGIDEDQLDREVLTHSRKVLKYGELEAEARHSHAQAKARLELAEAELLLEVRKRPSAFGLPEKPSIDVCKAAVVSHRRYQKCLEELNQSKFELDVYAAATNSLEHRKHMISNVIDLFKRDYHSEPRVANDRESASARHERVMRSSTKSMKPRPKKG